MELAVTCMKPSRISLCTHTKITPFGTLPRSWNSVVLVVFMKLMLIWLMICAHLSSINQTRILLIAESWHALHSQVLVRSGDCKVNLPYDRHLPAFSCLWSVLHAWYWYAVCCCTQRSGCPSNHYQKVVIGWLSSGLLHRGINNWPDQGWPAFRHVWVHAWAR